MWSFNILNFQRSSHIQVLVLKKLKLVLFFPPFSLCMLIIREERKRNCTYRWLVMRNTCLSLNERIPLYCATWLISSTTPAFKPRDLALTFLLILVILTRFRGFLESCQLCGTFLCIMTMVLSGRYFRGFGWLFLFLSRWGMQAIFWLERASIFLVLTLMNTLLDIIVVSFSLY